MLESACRLQWRQLWCMEHETEVVQPLAYVQVGQAVDAEDLGEGFLVPPLIRFVNGEEAYLSMTNGGPHAFFNIEDHISKSTGKENTKFQVSSHLADHHLWQR